MVVVVHAPRCRPICVCINLHSPSTRLRAMLSLVASRSWAWCFIHFVLGLDPTVGLVRSCPPRQPLVVPGVTVMDPILSVPIPTVPSHPILAFLPGGHGGLPSSSGWSPSPFGPSSRTAGRPHSHSRSCSDPPTPPPSWAPRASLPLLQSPALSSLVCPGGLVWFGLVWSGPVWLCLASSSPCPALPCLGLVWL